MPGLPAGMARTYEDHLLGIVTVDDAIDVILPEEWQHRLPKLFR